MENRRSLYKRTLRVLLPVVILAGIIIGSCQIQRAHIKADNGVVYVKAKVVQIIEDNSGGQPFSGAQKVRHELQADSIGDLIANWIIPIHISEVRSVQKELR